LMGDKENMLSLKDLLETIRIAKQNDKIAGIYIESGLLSSGSASLEAIRRSLIDFKESGKFVVAYADNFTQGNYFLCSVADKVFLNPQGILELTGLASQTLFYKGLMDKVGIEMQIFKVGTYKGAVEPFMLDKLSEANREQIQSYISTIWDNITEGIAESRGISVNDINHYANEGLFFADPVKTVECGFIDELKYKPEVEAYVKELAGQNGEKLRSANLAQMKTLKASPTKNAPEIALNGIDDLTSLKQMLAPFVQGNPNLFYMIKAGGVFKTMHTQSWNSCRKPYPVLSEAAKSRNEFCFENTRGNVIAVWCPRYVDGICIPDWHFHYLSSDKTQGGHILDLSAERLHLKINRIGRFDLLLPQTTEFAHCELREGKSAAAERFAACQATADKLL
jgi:alpha-acetolactate decarboxylase